MFCPQSVFLCFVLLFRTNSNYLIFFTALTCVFHNGGCVFCSVRAVSYNYNLEWSESWKNEPFGPIKVGELLDRLMDCRLLQKKGCVKLNLCKLLIFHDGWGEGNIRDGDWSPKQVKVNLWRMSFVECTWVARLFSAVLLIALRRMWCDRCTWERWRKTGNEKIIVTGLVGYSW